MILNKKGMTLVELIISVALLSIVLGFLFKILLDVKYESDDAGFAISNQANRAEIIKEVQNDLIDNGGVKKNYVYESDVTFQFSDDTYKVLRIVDENSIHYDGKKWTIQDENYKFGTITSTIITDEFKCYEKITIPVINIGDDDVLIDDIEIFTELITCSLEN